MASESLPRYMFLHEDSQEMSDKRIRTYQVYKESNDKAERVFVKRVNNTISNTHQPHSEGIFNLEYSNKYGLLLQATEDAVLVINNLELQSNLLKGKQNPENSKAIKFGGQIYLSPSEDILAVCSESFIQLLYTEKLPAMTHPPIAKNHQFHRFLWATDSKMLLWGFEAKASLITINPKNLEKVSEEEMQGATECTGASIVGINLLICQKLEILIYELGENKLIKKVDLNFEGHGWMYYEYSYIIDVFRVNVHKSPLELNARLKVPLDKEDVLGLVMVFYDDEDFENNERCLTFFRGNLLQGGKDIRGNENFYVAQDRNELYFQDDKKIPFGVKVEYVGCFICIMVERSSTVYVVDPFQKFEVINIYSPHGKLDFKAQGKFFRGMGVMKSMLPFEKRVPEDVKSGILPKIVNDFNGEFMSLYFADQETNLTVPFPATVIALTQNNLYRRYAISSLGGIDKDQDQQIIAEMQKIKRSPYLQNSRKQGVKAISEERMKNQPKKSLFGAPKAEQAPKASLFGAPKPAQAPKPSLFGAPKAEQAPKASLFGAPKAEQAPKMNIFDVPKAPQSTKPSFLGGFFSGQTNQPYGFSQKIQNTSSAINDLNNNQVSQSYTFSNYTPQEQEDIQYRFNKMIQQSIAAESPQRLFQALYGSIDSLKADLKEQQSTKFSRQKKLTMQAIQQFCENQLRQFETAQKLCLGGPLQRLLQKAESTRTNCLHYEQILQSSSGETLTQSQIQTQLSQLENRVVKGLYYNGYINPKQTKQSKMPSLGMSLQRERRKMDFLVDDFYTIMDRVRDRLTRLNGEMITHYQIFQKKRMKRIVKSIKNENSRYSKVFDFNSFNQNSDQDSQKHDTQERDSTPKTKIISSFIKFKNNKKKKSTIMVIVNLNQLEGKPKYTLPQLEEEVEKPSLPFEKEKVEQSSPAKAKLPATPSFNKINQAFTMSPASQASQKVQVPQVNVKELQMQQNQAKSQVLDASFSQSQDNIPLPVANRQISKIQINPPKQKSNLSSLLGPADNFGFASTTTKGQGSLFGVKTQPKEDKKEAKKQASVGLVAKKQKEGTNKSGATDKPDQNAKLLSNLLFNDRQDEKRPAATDEERSSSQSRWSQPPSSSSQLQERVKLTDDPFGIKEKLPKQPKQDIIDTPLANQLRVPTNTKIPPANPFQTKKTTTPPTPNNTNLLTQTTSNSLFNKNTSVNIAPQQIRTPTPLMNQEHKPAFGEPNKFLGQNMQVSQPQKPAFDPKAMTFGGGSTAQKSFTSISGQNPFPQNNPLTQSNTQQNTQQNSAFSSFNSSGMFSNQNAATQNNNLLNATPIQGNVFGNAKITVNQDSMLNKSIFSNAPSSNTNFLNSNALNNNSLGSFGTKSANTGVFIQNASTFGQTNNTGGNFLQGFVPKPNTMPVGVNPNLLAPRK